MTVDGKLFTALNTNKGARKLYLHPVLTASGKRVTRAFPPLALRRRRAAIGPRRRRTALQALADILDNPQTEVLRDPCRECRLSSAF